MKHLLLSGLGLLLVPALASAQQYESGWAAKIFTKNGTSNLVHDFGTVPRGTLLSYKFPIFNPYAVPLTITQVRVSCGCVSCTAPPGPIGPKESATLDITMDARKFQGPKTVAIFVTVGPQYVSTAVLQVTAVSRVDVVVNFADQQRTTLGIVPQGQSAMLAFFVEYAGTFDWHITGVVPTNAPLDVKFQEVNRAPGRVKYQVNVTLKANAPAGSFKQEVVLQTNDPQGQFVPLLVEGMVQAPLAVVPPEKNFGTVRIGQVVSQNVIIRGNGRPFRILQVDGQGDGLTVEILSTSTPNQVVTIRYRPVQPGTLKRELRFRTDLEHDLVADMTVEAVAAP